VRKLRTRVSIRPPDRLFDGLDPEQRRMAEQLLAAYSLAVARLSVAELKQSPELRAVTCLRQKGIV
jgi:hypothetical protein